MWNVPVAIWPALCSGPWSATVNNFEMIRAGKTESKRSVKVSSRLRPVYYGLRHRSVPTPTNRSGSWWNRLSPGPDGVLIAQSTNLVGAIRITWLRQSANRLPEGITHGFPTGSFLVAFATISPLPLGNVDTSLNSIFRTPLRARLLIAAKWGKNGLCLHDLGKMTQQRAGRKRRRGKFSWPDAGVVGTTYQQFRAIVFVGVGPRRFFAQQSIG